MVMENRTNENLLQGNGLYGAFTLIELIVVIVIISIAAAMVVPMMSSAGDIQLRSAANKLAADLEYAKSMAISRGQTYTVVFDTTEDSYQIEDSSDTVITHPVRKGNYIEQFGGTSTLSKVRISNANFNGGPSVTFESIGSPDNGGAVTLTAGDDTIIVNVEAVTGYISISN